MHVMTMSRPGASQTRRVAMRGMTLIEVLMVMAIFSLLVGTVIYGFGTTRSAEKLRAINQITSTIRFGYDKARVNGTYFRLFIDLEDGTFALQEADGQMYLPATDRQGRLVEFDAAAAEDQESRDQRAAESYNRSLQAQLAQATPDSSEDGDGFGSSYDPYAAAPRKVPRRKPPLFAVFEGESVLSEFRKPVKLPTDLRVTYVRTADDAEPVTSGQASLYFFPRGRTQQAHIFLEDDQDNEWTIKVAPLTGRVVVVDGHEELELPDEVDDVVDDLGRKAQERVL